MNCSFAIISAGALRETISRRLRGSERGMAPGRQLWVCFSTLEMDGDRESGPVEGPSLHSLAAGKGVPIAALDGDLGFVPLQSWSWDPPQDSKGMSLLLPLPFSPPSWALALLD